MVELIFGESLMNCCLYFSSLWHNSPTQTRSASFLRFLDRTQWHITLSRIPLDEWSARRWDLYLSTHTTFTRDRHPLHRGDSSQQSQQASGRRPLAYSNRWLPQLTEQNIFSDRVLRTLRWIVGPKKQGLCKCCDFKKIFCLAVI